MKILKIIITYSKKAKQINEGLIMQKQKSDLEKNNEISVKFELRYDF